MSATLLVGNKIICKNRFRIEDVLNGRDIIIEEGFEHTISNIGISDKISFGNEDIYTIFIQFSELSEHILLPVDVLNFFVDKHKLYIEEYFTMETKDKFSNRRQYEL